MAAAAMPASTAKRNMGETAMTMDASRRTERYEFEAETEIVKKQARGGRAAAALLDKLIYGEAAEAAPAAEAGAA